MIQPMRICPSCAANVPADSQFCPACGAPLGMADAATTPGAQFSATTPSGSFVPADLPSGSDRTQFLPGTVLDGRYRVVGLLGRGGMGEVYRTDDLKLGQPVALKFLPEGLERDPGRLERFLNEARTARQVTHANVCRVYDIGEIGGKHFLSMEYIDGEDLSSLLRRIGRLPQERAVEVARQICAGLAAAHETGILHRDLKPANIMIDGRGRVRITDFGLAGVADRVAEDVGAGTPAYMAPEQIAGKAPSIQSDLYALGLVLYEIFTGQPVYRAETVADLRRMQESTPPSSPSSHVQNLDPAVERTILHCLERDPADRPGSALAVAAALPGGDPLAAALAAGETPSPELVASAGRTEAMAPWKAVLVAVLGLAVFIAGARWAGTQTLIHFLPLEKRPEVLIDRSQEILEQLGYIEPVYTDPVDTAWGFISWGGVIGEVGEADSSRARWEGLRDRPDAAAFWYRQSPRIMAPVPDEGPVFSRGRVGMMNPFPEHPGHVSIGLDLDGSLRRLAVMPKRFAKREAAEPDWAPLFEMADLDPADFTEVEPMYQRFSAPDHRHAWLGTRPDRPGVEYRVEAGSFGGRPILFNIAPAAGMESLGEDPEPRLPDPSDYVDFAVMPLFFLVIMAVAAVMARRNMRRGRADRRGAWRLAVLFFGLGIATMALSSPLTFTVYGFGELWPMVAAGFFYGLLAGGWYLAAEPLGRQVWPTMFVTSSRLLSRPRTQWRDPLIGWSVLIGLAAGAVMSLVAPAARRLQGMLDGLPPSPLASDWIVLFGQSAALTAILDRIFVGILLTIVMLIVLVVGRLVLRKRWAAVLLAGVMMVALNNPTAGIVLATSVLAAAIGLAVLLRWGIVAAATAMIVSQLGFLARVSDWSAWYADAARMALGVVALLAAYGIYAATGGRRATSGP